MPNGPEERSSGREIRLLMLVIAVAVLGLLVLARFRFPEAEIVSVSPTPPLERLAARAPFDDLASAVADGSARVAPLIVTVEFERTPEKAPRKTSPDASSPPSPPQLLPGLRVKAGLVVAHMPAGMRAARVGAAAAQVVASDAERAVVLVVDPQSGRTPPGPGPDVADLSSGASNYTGAAYGLAVDVAPGGAAIGPLFVARADPVTVDRWTTPLLRIPPEPQAHAGVFLFTLDGHLIGLVLPQPGGLVVADAAALDRVISELAGGRQ